MKQRRKRRVKGRSYRQVRQVLLAFGVAGAVLGLVLLAYFGYRRHFPLAAVGGIYLLVACLLLGIRGVLGHLDELRRHNRPRGHVLPAAGGEAP